MLLDGGHAACTSTIFSEDQAGQLVSKSLSEIFCATLNRPGQCELVPIHDTGVNQGRI